MKLIKLSDAVKTGKLPMQYKTAIRWRREGTAPGLIVKIGNRLFLDLDKLEDLVKIDTAKQKQKQKQK